MAAGTTNQLFWLYFADAMKTKSKAELGADNVFFVGSEVQKGPPGGDNMEEEWTNRGLFDMGDALLSTDNLFFIQGSSNHSYTDALSQYLAWADPEATGTSQDQTALNNAEDLLKSLDVKVKATRTAALGEYEAEKTAGNLGDGKEKPVQNFFNWWKAGNAPSYQGALDERDQAAVTISTIKARISGPKALAIKKDTAKINQALSHAKNTGFTMRVFDGSPPSQAQRNLWKNDPDSKPALPEPDYLPAYNAPDYIKFIKDVQTKYGNGNTKYGEGDSVEFHVDTSKSTSDFHFGQTHGGADVGVSWPGWFTINANANHSESKETLDTGSETSSIKVKIFFDEVRAVTVRPGSWNFDVTQYKLRPGAPKNLKTLARVQQIIVASRLGYEITLGASLGKTVDTKVKQATSAGGSVSILGIPISLGGSGGSSSEDNSHRAEFSSDGRTIKVIPKDEDHTATIIGAIGEKFSITAA